MRRLILLTGIMIIIGLTASGLNPVMAYTIDGLLFDDWGIDLSSANIAGDLDSMTPSTTQYYTEDNAGVELPVWTNVGPGWSWLNYFDAEAIYFNYDQDNAYIAIVTGLTGGGVNPPGNSYGSEGDSHKFTPGDIALDIDGDGDYEYGLNISDSKLYYGSTWLDAVYTWAYPHLYNPWAIDEDNKGILKVGDVEFVYSGEQNTHYVLEAKIPLGLLGLTGSDYSKIGIHWGMECGNDYLNLEAEVEPIPEPASLLLLGSGLLGLVVFGSIRRKRS